MRPGLLLLLCALASGAAAQGDASRPFGHVIGDEIEQRIALRVGAARFDPVELPRAERVGMSLWRRAVRVDTDAGGEKWLVLRYQIVNTPPALAVWELPPLQLRSMDPAVSLRVAAWPFSVGPFTPRLPFGKGELTGLRGDHGAPVFALAPLERRMKLAACGLALSLLLWSAYVYRRQLRSGRERPFARAVRDMRGLREDAPDAWRRLQHALNDAAGHVVRADTLDALMARAPYLAPERGALERFCRDASALFFGSGLPADAPSVHALATRLRKRERRHA